MKRAKQFFRQLATLLCAILLLINSAIPANAFERKEHDKYMEQVMFKNFKEIDNDPSPNVQKAIEALECASYLTIDQCNGYGQSDLDTLIQYGVKGIPSSVSEISFSAFKHRSYTHRGWNYSYGTIMTEIWPLRQAILRNTVNAVFDFQGDTAKAEAFCELIYYIHILGDHMDDESLEKRKQNGGKMDAGGRTDKYDVIHELLKCFEVLFADQTHTHKYSKLTSTLERYNSKFAKIVRREGGINTDEEFKLHQKYVKDLMKVLTLYLPEMLKEETFFSDVFYK